MGQDNPKILIVRLGAMGDVIHTLPAVTYLRASLGANVIIDWLIEPRWMQLLAAGDVENLDRVNEAGRDACKPVVDRIRLADTKRWRNSLFSLGTALEFLSMGRKLRSYGYDAVIDLQGSIKSAYLASKAGCRVLGSSKPREWPASIYYDRTADQYGEHIVHQYQGITESIYYCLDDKFEFEDSGENTSDSPYGFGADPGLLPRDPASETWCETELVKLGVKQGEKQGERFALLTPGAGWPAKQWPAEKFGELARLLAKDGILSLINMGPNETDLGDAVEYHSNHSARRITCTISQLIALTRRAALFVGGDTGPMHLANALGIPVVALFGPTDPIRNGPYYQPNVVLRSPLSKTSYSHKNMRDEGLESITVEEVMNAANNLLRQAGTKGR